MITLRLPALFIIMIFIPMHDMKADKRDFYSIDKELSYIKDKNINKYRENANMINTTLGTKTVMSIGVDMDSRSRCTQIIGMDNIFEAVQPELIDSTIFLENKKELQINSCYDPLSEVAFYKVKRQYYASKANVDRIQIFGQTPGTGELEVKNKDLYTVEMELYRLWAKIDLSNPKITETPVYYDGETEVFGTLKGFPDILHARGNK